MLVGEFVEAEGQAEAKTDLLSGSPQAGPKKERNYCDSAVQYSSITLLPPRVSASREEGGQREAGEDMLFVSQRTMV